MGNPPDNNNDNPPRRASTDNTHRQHKPPPQSFLPSIKIIQPHKGAASPRPDERCLTYCSQSIAGRIGQREPWCRSICIRRVFAHEVRNIINYKTHNNAQPNGEAKYPLPPEGRRRTQTDTEEGQFPIKDPKHWEEGWYLWVTKSRMAAVEKMNLMTCDLEHQSNWLDSKEKRKREWEEWQAQQKRTGHNHVQANLPPSPDTQERWAVVEPPQPYPDTSEYTILLHLPPPLPPIYQKVQKLLDPTYRVMELFHQSFETGAQQKLAVLAWQKAQTRDPFRLVGTVCGQMWERWKAGPPDDSDRKDDA